MLPNFIKEANIPHKPGIYIYRNSLGQIIYVGKAIDLQKRVSSYFAKNTDSLKTSHLVLEIRSVEFIVVASELEALILEANLIKKHLPQFNVRLTDDKDYLYIKITKGDFPQVVTARKQGLTDAKKYFGPFPSSTTVKSTLKSLRRIFPWCSNPPKEAKEGSTSKRSLRPCFYFHIKLCPGACAGVINSTDYKKNIHRLGLLLDGKKDELWAKLNEEMQQYSKTQEFEKAERVKRMIAGLQYLTQPNRSQIYLENPNFIEDQNQSSLEEMQKELGLPDLPERIECYDISNISGTNATGSMVVLSHGEIDKSQYRKFKIKITGKPDDYAMHQEMMQRRLSHPEWPLPQLFLIDGGRGQVRASFIELEKKGISVPIYGIAKRMEWLYPPEGEVVKLDKSSLALRALQKIRDEAHRFAITYHRKLRSKAFLGR